MMGKILGHAAASLLTMSATSWAATPDEAEAGSRAIILDMQRNGCAYCVDMHTKEARRDGLSEQWINLICVWRDSPVFDARERAILGYTEALTDISQTHAPDADFEPLRSHFTEAEITRISVAIGTINVWSRLCVGFRSQHPVDGL
ncbi:carboxymuconolactone decarboxylase family protein [Pantanalinema rosaneae CENA516]|uniref:carboxymuconolactone decarboxylase family protein n=1 Tax=Pantanalinema rosaneae TaxID=1620701 RepID=UPI003D6FF759